MHRKLFVSAAVVCLMLSVLATAADVPAPDFMGLYTYDGSQLTKLDRAFSTTADNSAGKSVVGFPANTNFPLVQPDVVFVAYHEKIELLEANIIGLTWEGIKMLDGQEFKSENYELNMYVRDGEKIVRFNVAPLEGQNFTYKYVPEKPLAPGKYLFYFGRSLKDARVADQDKVFVFEIVK
ncbi:MAG: hypothetical protein P9M14_10270 [Candidatus Alcyoniella australis]|nr:hypothetical protein [Candidatus Alcyoniella australis]